MSAWVEYNPNPAGRRVGDCAVRAVARALGIGWKAAYLLIAANGLQMFDMPTSDSVWGAELRQHGFRRYAVPNTCPDCYTAEDFARDNPDGIYVLGFGGHVATIEDGALYDSWDSSTLTPQYFWHKEG